MNKSARKSLFKGLAVLFVILAISAGYVAITSQVKSASQSIISAQQYNVAVDYSGLISQKLVEEGEFVEKGQDLVHIKSSSLLEDLNEKRVTQSDLLYPLNEKKELVVQAQQSGKIKDSPFAKGSFVPANQTIFTIIDTKNPFAESMFDMSRDEFEKLSEQTVLEIELPNNRVVKSRITLIDIDLDKKDTGDTIRVKIKSELEPNGNLLIGSPLTTRLYLEENTPVQRFISSLTNFKNRIF